MIGVQDGLEKTRDLRDLDSRQLHRQGVPIDLEAYPSQGRPERCLMPANWHIERAKEQRQQGRVERGCLAAEAP